MIQVYKQTEDGVPTYDLETYPRMSAVSDGYHTFGELYEYRMLLQAMVFNQWAEQDKWYREEPNFDPLKSFNVHKSWRHSDGELCFGKENYFIVMATLPGIGQISNHYKGENWDLFNVPEQEFADEYDGHTPQDAAKRMYEYIKASL